MLSMTKTEIKNIKLTTENGDVIEFRFKIPGQPTELIKGNSIAKSKTALSNLESAKMDDNVSIFTIKDGTNSNINPLVITITE